LGLLTEFQLNISSIWKALLESLKLELKSELIFTECSVFFDEGKLIVLVNGFQKKSQKTPKGEIELAEKLKKQYFDEKKRK